jgi:predicted DNA-binding transcriptional regulator YafY
MRPIAVETFDAAALRRAIRDRRKLSITYQDADGRPSRRTVWPVFVAYMEEVRIIIAWCELRQGFRHFRTDRICSIEVAAERYPEPRYVLLKRWKAAERDGARAGRTAI